MKQKASEAVKYLEGVSFYEDKDGEEVVRIAEAIRATQLAEMEILTWALGVPTKQAIENRIAILKAKLN